MRRRKYRPQEQSARGSNVIAFPLRQPTMLDILLSRLPGEPEFDPKVEVAKILGHEPGPDDPEWVRQLATPLDPLLAERMHWWSLGDPDREPEIDHPRIALGAADTPDAAYHELCELGDAIDHTPSAQRPVLFSRILAVARERVRREWADASETEAYLMKTAERCGVPYEPPRSNGPDRPKARDANDVLREDGEVTVRAMFDGAAKSKPTAARHCEPPQQQRDASTSQTGYATTNTNNSIIDWTVAEKLNWLKGVADLPPDFSTKGKAIIAHSGNLKDLNFDLNQAGALVKPYQTWSEVSFALAAIFKADGRYGNEQIAAALMTDLECNQRITKITDQAKQRRAVERLILRTYAPPQPQKMPSPDAPDWRERRLDQSPLPSMHNARLAITALGIACSYETFHNKLLFGYQDDTTRHVIEHINGEVTDNGIIALRQLMSETFGFDLTDKHTRDAVISLALEHCFDPVVDMLAKAEASWDGVKRLDRMAADYLNCEDTKLNAACLRKTMIAAVARARQPGIKFDTILVLESEEGYNKSTAWRVLAGDENFSDERVLGKDSREVQEQLAEIWIHENADLAGMKKADVEMVKAHASRITDIARPAYGHFVMKQRRHSIEVGTTNSTEYLQSQTGNRRFWPMRVLKIINIDNLRRDRLQLLGEAAHYQSQGESLVLDQDWWETAGKEQEARRVSDPWEDVLRDMPRSIVLREYQDGDKTEKEVLQIIHSDPDRDQVAAADILQHILKIPPSAQRVDHSMRLANVMKQLGWQRPSNGRVTINSKRVKGYLRNKSG